MPEISEEELAKYKADSERALNLAASNKRLEGENTKVKDRAKDAEDKLSVAQDAKLKSENDIHLHLKFSTIANPFGYNMHYNFNSILEPDEIIQAFVITGSSYNALTNQGQIYTWGTNDSGQLGLGDSHHRTVAVILDFPDNTSLQN